MCYLLRRYPLSRFQVLSCSFEGRLVVHYAVPPGAIALPQGLCTCQGGLDGPEPQGPFKYRGSRTFCLGTSHDSDFVYYLI